MSDRPFLDTNILVYAFDQANPKKQQRAWEILDGQVFQDSPTISTQVIQEFYVTVVRKLKVPLDEEKAYAACLQLADFPVVQITTDLVLSAVRFSQTHQLSYWDALIIEAAKSAGCTVLVTEDLQDGYAVDGLKIQNPFVH
jgi:predicted nucleic acid-binding protein